MIRGISSYLDLIELGTRVLLRYLRVHVLLSVGGSTARSLDCRCLHASCFTYYFTLGFESTAAG